MNQILPAAVYRCTPGPAERPTLCASCARVIPQGARCWEMRSDLGVKHVHFAADCDMADRPLARSLA